MLRNLIPFFRNDRGATAIEYAFLVALISISAITAYSAVSDSIVGVFSPVEEELARCVEVGSNCNH